MKDLSKETMFDGFRFYDGIYELSFFFKSPTTDMIKFVFIATWNEDTKLLDMGLYSYMDLYGINLLVPVSLIEHDLIKLDTFKSVYKKIKMIVDSSLICSFNNNRTILDFNNDNMLFKCISAEIKYNSNRTILTVKNRHGNIHKYVASLYCPDTAIIESKLTDEVYTYTITDDIRTKSARLYHADPVLYPVVEPDVSDNEKV